MKHTLSITVKEPFNELTRIIGLFSDHGLNIESFNVTETPNAESTCRMFVTTGGSPTIKQLLEQLNQDDSVVSVVELTAADHIEREMVLLHVNAKSGADRLEVVELANIFGARVINALNGTITLEAMGERDRLNDFLQLLQPFGICDIARGAALAIEKRPTIAKDTAA
jgi:acetolactate synthase-1/3 small subunit